MGHYAAEMMCDKCGWCRCICPPAPDSTLNHWVVGDGYRVMKAKDFQALISGSGRLAHFERMTKKHFKKREEAEVHARENCEAAVQSAREQLTRLKKVLKVERPWEAK